MKLCLISDTHDNHRQIKIPECDVLVVAGDFTCHRQPILANYVDFNDWLREVPLPASRIIVVAGNHDTLLEQRNEFARSIFSNATYLQDSGTQIDGINFWGSPWTPFFANWAFMKPDEWLSEYWQKIPDGINVLVTHGGPYGILDKVEGQSVGSYSLLERVSQLKELKLHVFGHIHEARGQEGKFVNAAMCDPFNNLVNEPTIIEI